MSSQEIERLKAEIERLKAKFNQESPKPTCTRCNGLGYYEDQKDPQIVYWCKDCHTTHR